MNNKTTVLYKKFFFIMSFVMGITSIILIISNGIYSYLTVSIKLPLRILANFLIASASIIIRFILINKDNFNTQINLSDPVNHGDLKTDRFINFIFISMIIGFIATIMIHIKFYLGALIYFLMHIAIIISFSGIIYINPYKLKQDIRLFLSQILIYIFLMPLCLFIFIFINYKKLTDFIFLPYVVILIFTFVLGVLGLFYIRGALLFRIFIFFGCLLFLISDFLIGYVGNNNRDSILIYFIGPTYVAAIFLLTFSQFTLGKCIRMN